MAAHPRTFAALGLLVASLITAACDSASPSANAERATTTTSTSTTAPPEPAHVVIGGDSVGYDVAPALQAALHPADAFVSYVVAPAIGKAAIRAQLVRTVADGQADALVVMVGIWERAHETSTGASLGEPGFEEAYAHEVLDPLVAALQPTGTTLVLVREPAMRDTSTETDLTELGDMWSRYASLHPDTVRYLDARAWLGGEQGFQEKLTSGTGPMRVRRVDGIHLCAAGAARVAQGLLDTLPTVLDNPWAHPFAAGWETGTWTSRFPVDECPA